YVFMSYLLIKLVIADANSYKVVVSDKFSVFRFDAFEFDTRRSKQC
ncbi:1307_t:CDS:1, partial [Dentiscutata erythropus]